MISEGSCDTEDWSNDAENSVLHHLHFARNLFGLIYFFQKHLTNKNLPTPKTFEQTLEVYTEQYIPGVHYILLMKGLTTLVISMSANINV